MLDRLNRYAHGYIAVPVILAFRSGGGFRKLAEGVFTVNQLAGELSANTGHLRVALRLLESLGWCEIDADERIRLTPAAAAHDQIPQDLLRLFDRPVGNGWLNHLEPDRFRDLVALSRGRWQIREKQLADIIDGALFVPLLLSIRGPDNFSEETLLSTVPDSHRAAVVTLFLDQGWSVRDRGVFELTDMGRTLLDRIPIMGTVASYRPMLSRMDDLLFGDASAVFQRDDSGHETHVDRGLNVAASGFQHDRYFADVEEIVAAIFNQSPFGDQPKYVADMGCGDGTLLRRIYETIRRDTERGKVLDQFPVTLIGVDYNEKSLQATANTLAGLPHLVLHGDIADPRQLLTDLRQHGVADPENILHVRSFLDHDRPFRMPADEQAVQRQRAVPHSGVYTLRDGRPLEAAAVMQSLVEHLRRWSEITSRFGLIVLEVHSLPPRVVREFLDESENLHYDAFHGFSGQLLVEPDAFLMAAAEAGLFPDKQFLRSYPKLLPFTRITLNRFEPRPYIIRHARHTDLDALLRLEAACWDEALRASADRIVRRITRHPKGQFVLETNEGIAGVMYTQRIADPKSLESARDETVEELFDRNGRSAQLIAVNVSPSHQQRGLGDQLLEFVLQVLGVTGGIELAVGVTRCRDYAGHPLPMSEYVRLRDGDGAPLDPILRFHHSHGAKIVQLVPGYRPADHDNQSIGILIEYDLRRRQSMQSAPLAASTAMTTARDQVASFVNATIQEILGAGADGFSPAAALLDLGLDSMAMLELRTVLSRHFHQELDSTFLFEHDTPEAIIGYFAR